MPFVALLVACHRDPTPETSTVNPAEKPTKTHVVMPPPEEMRPSDVDKLPSSPVTLTAAYGSDPLQNGDLRVPSGAGRKGPFPVLVVIHGGCWKRGFATKQNTAALASAITDLGYATWNIDYRQIGDPGGTWPGTFQDWGNATDYLRELAKTQPLDLSHVSTIGHSAGAQAAAWLAARPQLPPTSQVRGANPLSLRAAVVVDGPPELPAFIGPDSDICGSAVVSALMGGLPADQSARYADAEPLGRGPLPPMLLIASSVLPSDEADRYQAKAAAAGSHVQVVKAHDAGHFSLIAPGSDPWDTQIAAPLTAFLQRTTKP